MQTANRDGFIWLIAKFVVQEINKINHATRLNPHMQLIQQLAAQV